MSSVNTPNVRIHRAPGAGADTLAEDVRTGLRGEFWELPPKHLYDETGSQLFDEICGLPEYYPTRTERLILEQRAHEIATRTGATELVELGAGTAAKTRVLLDALTEHGTLDRYIAFDIEETVVSDAVQRIAAEYPLLSAVEAVVGDFERDLELIPAPAAGACRIVALLGGTIGNFRPAERRRLLAAIAGLLGPDGYLLLGADLVKDPDVIEAAYNDAAGVTARFNRNMLEVINRELDADFPVEDFAHVSFYDREQEWIEMRLRAQADARVRIAALELDLELRPGDEIRTEISAKFTPARLAADLDAGDLSIVELMTDPDDLFALVLAGVEPSRNSRRENG
jgi:L-histidine Nalpha-methyltransferase